MTGRKPQQLKGCLGSSHRRCRTMRCLQDCCEQEIDTGHCREAVSDQTLATTSRLPDVEVQDEPPELAVNGLEAMTSLNIMTKLSGSDSNETDEELFKFQVSERIRVTDWEILRGITLRESLCRGGSLWRKNPEYLSGLDNFVGCTGFSFRVAVCLQHQESRNQLNLRSSGRV